MVLIIEHDAVDTCRSKGTLYEELCVSCIADNVKVLVAELTNDTMHTTTLNTYAGSYWINTVVEALYGNLCTLSRETGNTADCYLTFCNLRNLSLKKTLEEE